MTPLTPYLAAGGLVALIGTGAGGYFFGKDVQRDRDRVEAQKQVDDLRVASRADERLLATQAGQIGQALNAALNRGDEQDAGQIRIIHDGLRSTPLAVSPGCRVPDGVRVAIAALYRGANGAADAAARAGGDAVGGNGGGADQP